MKSVYNLGQTTKHDSAQFWVGDTEIKEGYPLSPHAEQKMERKKFQRTRSLPKNARFLTSNKDIHNHLVLRGLFLRKERRNPCKNGKISSMKFCVALCKGLTHFTTNICSENNCSFPYHLTQFLSVFLQRMVFNFDTNDLK